MLDGVVEGQKLVDGCLNLWMLFLKARRIITERLIVNIGNLWLFVREWKVAVCSNIPFKRKTNQKPIQKYNRKMIERKLTRLYSITNASYIHLCGIVITSRMGNKNYFPIRTRTFFPLFYSITHSNLFLLVYPSFRITSDVLHHTASVHGVFMCLIIKTNTHFIILNPPVSSIAVNPFVEFVQMRSKLQQIQIFIYHHQFHERKFIFLIHLQFRNTNLKYKLLERKWITFRIFSIITERIHKESFVRFENIYKVDQSILENDFLLNNSSC